MSTGVSMAAAHTCILPICSKQLSNFILCLSFNRLGLNYGLQTSYFSSDFVVIMLLPFSNNVKQVSINYNLKYSFKILTSNQNLQWMSIGCFYSHFHT